MTDELKTKVHSPSQADRVIHALERFRSGISLLDTTYTPERSDALEFARCIRAGLGSNLWSRLRGIGFTTPELASVIGVSQKTISRKQTSAEPLDVVEGDRTMRLANVTLEAAQAFGNLEKAMRWLRKPNRVLGGDHPIELIATEPGAALVRRALGTIEYGGVA